MLEEIVSDVSVSVPDEGAAFATSYVTAVAVAVAVAVLSKADAALQEVALEQLFVHFPRRAEIKPELLPDHPLRRGVVQRSCRRHRARHNLRRSTFYKLQIIGGAPQYSSKFKRADPTFTPGLVHRDAGG